MSGTHPLTGMEQRWADGRTAFDAAPAEWRNRCEGLNDDERERFLLALASQFYPPHSQSLFPGSQEPQPPIPLRPLPFMPEHARTYFISAIRANSYDEMPWNIVRFVESRGYSPNPRDWLPSWEDHSLPDDYSDWAQWSLGECFDQPHPRAHLNADNWDTYSPKERKQQVENLLQRDRPATHLLLKEKLPSEPAAHRAQILDALSNSISREDLHFLSFFENDKSKYVRLQLDFLKHALTRNEDDNKQAPLSLTQAFKVHRRGVFRRKVTLNPTKPLTSKDVDRYVELLNRTSLQEITATFNLNTDEVTSAWLWGGERRLDLALLNLLARSECVEIRSQMFEILCQRRDIRTIEISALSEHLTSDQIRYLMATILDFDSDHVVLLERFKIRDFSWLDAATSLNCHLFKSTLSEIVNDDRNLSLYLMHIFDYLGLIATKSAAQALLRKIEYMGLDPAMTRYSMLNLNANL